MISECLLYLYVVHVALLFVQVGISPLPKVYKSLGRVGEKHVVSEEDLITGAGLSYLRSIPT